MIIIELEIIAAINIDKISLKISPLNTFEIKNSFKKTNKNSSFYVSHIY